MKKRNPPQEPARDHFAGRLSFELPRSQSHRRSSSSPSASLPRWVKATVGASRPRREFLPHACSCGMRNARTTRPAQTQLAATSASSVGTDGVRVAAPGELEERKSRRRSRVQRSCYAHPDLGNGVAAGCHSAARPDGTRRGSRSRLFRRQVIELALKGRVVPVQFLGLVQCFTFIFNPRVGFECSYLFAHANANTGTDILPA